MSAQLAELHGQRQQLTHEIGNYKREGRDVSALIARHRELSAAMRRIEAECAAPGSADDLPMRQAPAAGGRGALEATVIDTAEQLGQLRDEWEELRADSDSIGPFMTWEWLHTWWGSFGRDRPLRVIALHEPSGRLMGLAPLMVGVDAQSPWRGRAIGFLSSDKPEGEYLDFILRHGAERAGVSCILRCLQGLRSEWDIVRLLHMNAESKNLHLLQQLAGEYGLAVLVRPECPCVWGWLPRRYESFVQNLPSRNTREKLRRMQRKLEEDFSLIEWLDFHSVGETDAFMRTLADLHTQRFRHVGQPGSLADPKRLRNMGTVARLFAQRGRLRLKLLRLDGVDVAARIGFVMDGVWYDIQGGWLPQYGKYNVSHILLARCVKDSIAEGLTAFDLMAGEHGYKRKYFPHDRWLVSVTLFDGRLRSTGKVGRELLQDGLRPIVRRWAPWAAWAWRRLRRWAHKPRRARTADGAADD